MKFLIIRKKQIIFLLTIFLILLVLFSADLSGIFFKQLKFFFEEKLSKKFHATVKIGAIEGGILRGVIFKNFEIYRFQDKKKLLVLKVKKANLDYRFWHTLINFLSAGKEKFFIKRVHLFSPAIYMEGLLALEDIDKNIVSLNGKLKDAEIAKKQILGGFAEELKIFIDKADIYFKDRTKPLIRELTGRFTLGKDWMNGEVAQAELAGVPVAVSCRFSDIFKDIRFDLQFSSYYLDLLLNINGTFKDFNIFGMLDLFNRKRSYFLGNASLNESEFLLKNLTFDNRYDLSGKYKLKEKQLFLEAFLQGNKIMKINSHFDSLSEHKTAVELFNINLGNYQFSAGIGIKTALYNLNRKGDFKIQGKLNTSQMMINARALPDLFIDFEFVRNHLVIKRLSFAKGAYRGKGWLELASPYHLDFEFKIAKGQLADLWVLGKDESGREVNGEISGKFKFFGTLPSLKMKGHLESRNGDLDNFKYEHGYAVLEAEGPVIRIIDGFLKKKDGDCVLGGQIDLRKAGTAEIIKQLKIRPALSANKFEKGIGPQGEDASQLVVGKDLSKRVHVDYKAPYDDETKYEDKQKAEWEFKYRLKKNQTLKMRLKEDEEYISVEHKLKF